MSTRKPYSGSQRKLVLAFDVGTTFSGISYSILDPKEIPEIRGVTRYPAQEQVGGDSKIPTVIYYDKDGQVRAVGAEAMKEGVEDQAEDEGWTKAEWFKLHLRPQNMSSSGVAQHIPALPMGKTAVDVLADFLRYLHQSARTYIEETHANGVKLWETLQPRTDFVLSHPNGWEGAQQSMMRKAAVKAELIPNNPAGQRRLSFVTEGEASLHFCIQSGLTSRAMEEGKGVLIVDAGGGTIDISAYKQTSPEIKSFEEMAAPQCHFHGSIFVTNNAKTYLEDFLDKSNFAEDVPHITKCFDKTTKLRFRNAEEPQYIKFGSFRDKDPRLNIRSGQLRLNGSVVASFFLPSIECIVQSIEQQRAASATEIESVFLVGGFGASDWLFSNLRDRFSDQGVDISRPDSHLNKAVADGAVSFYLDHFVSTRVSKYTYGAPLNVLFNPHDPEHLARANTSFIDIDGQKRIPRGFDIILPKNTKVTEVQEFRRSYCRLSNDPLDLTSTQHTLQCYSGPHTSPKWVDQNSDMYSILCTITSDSAGLPLHPRISLLDRSMYYRKDFDIILSFGLTELKAQTCWMENGVEKRSPAKIVYDPEELVLQ